MFSNLPNLIYFNKQQKYPFLLSTSLFIHFIKAKSTISSDVALKSSDDNNSTRKSYPISTNNSSSKTLKNIDLYLKLNQIIYDIYIIMLKIYVPFRNFPI